MTGSLGEVNNMVKFGTLEYYQVHADVLNKDPDWIKGAFTSNLLYVFSDVLGADGQPKAFLLKFDKGKVTASEAKASDISSKEIEFAQTANYAMHVGIAKGEISVQKAKLKLSMIKIMKHQKTFMRILETAQTLKDVEY